MAELPMHQVMNFADEAAYDVPRRQRADFWKAIEGHAEAMRLALEDHPAHTLSDSEDCSICRQAELAFKP